MVARPKLFYILAIILAIAAVLDTATFFYFISNNSVDFEINPLLLLLKPYVSIGIGIAIVLVYKLAVNAGIIWLLFKYKPKNTHLFAFLLTLAIVIATLLQFAGAYQNVNMHTLISEAPPDDIPQPLTSEQSFNMLRVVNVFYWAFICLQVLTFMLYERLFKPPQGVLLKSSHSL